MSLLDLRQAVLPAVLLVSLAACGGPSPAATPTTFTAVGTITTKADPEKVGPNDICPQTTYPDIASGTSVTVTDATGKVVGVGALDYPKVKGTVKVDGSNYPVQCQYDFTVAALPIGSHFYGFEVARRGVVQEPADAARAPVLTLGS